MRKIKEIWRLLLYSGTDGLNYFSATRGICIGVNLICVCVILINLSIGFAFSLVTGEISLLFGSLFEVILVAGLIRLNFLRKYTAANLGLYLVLNIATVYFATVLGKTADVQLMIVFLVGLALFSFESRLIRFLCILTTLLLFVFIEINYKQEYIKAIDLPDAVRDFMRWAALAVVLFLVILILFLYARNKALLDLLNLHAQKVGASLKDAERLIQTGGHEIRHGLYGVTGITDILMQKIADKGEFIELKNLVEHLNASSHNLKILTDNFLELSKTEAGIKQDVCMEAVDIRQMFGNLVLVNRYWADQRNVRISLSISEEIPRLLLTDEAKVMSIVNNLINNAIKFTREGTTISIGIFKDDSTWKIFVEDEGKGISEENKQRIFLPFVTEKESNDFGVGLGLHIAMHFVKLLQGGIEVTSKLKRGARFTVTLPFIRVDTEKINIIDEGQDTGVVDLQGLHVLVAEDSELMSFVIRANLLQLGCKVQMVMDGNELLGAVKKQVPDLILLDYHMPYIDGEEATTELKKDPLLRRIPIIILTGDLNSELLDRFLEAGADGYLEKPVNIETLRKTISRHCRQKAR
jgi:two-component system, sensor histidine kinase